MTDAPSSHAKGLPAIAFTEIDASCRLPLCVMFVSAALWLVIGSVFALLSGPVCHNNYLLWWLPAFCVLLAGPLAGLVSRSPLTTRLVQR